MPEAAPSPATLAILFGFILASLWIGGLAHRVVGGRSFLKGYFLGNRGLGAWALALTATVQSGGTFMGFPSLVYSHGWVVAIWIASYMVVPITGFGILAKRFAQLSRRTGAITVPDLFRERFASPRLGLVSSLLIMFYMVFMMVAQFKAGALIIKAAWPQSGPISLGADPSGGLGRVYYVGLLIFTLSVVGYTLIGGFLAAVWTDLFQSLLMLLGVLILLPLALSAAGGMEQATRAAVANTGPGFVSGPGYSIDGRSFHPVGLAVSFFFIWVFAGIAAPASMVRVMASSDTQTIRRSIVLLSFYNALIYVPLVVICVAARALMPHLEVSDEVIPRITLWTTSSMTGGSFLAGLILAAPFGAVMSTVSSYLVVITSGFVRDVYQRFVEPEVSEARLRRLSHLVMICLGAVAVVSNIQPVGYLQALVVFSGTSAAATFIVPALMAVFWKRATAAGALAAMLSGSGTMLSLFCAGWVLSWAGYDPMIGQATRFRPHYLCGLDPMLWSMTVSLVVGVGVSLATKPPPAELVARCFAPLPSRRHAS
jgi:SSS family solute:Na+ symporter/sodium/pantothenate symporter